MHNCEKQYVACRFEHLRKIDLNSVIYFITVINYRTVYNASVALQCSPPTVSVMLKRFCSYFPVPLFEREGRNLVPTRYGRELHRKIECIFFDIESFLSDDLGG